ncbi:MAG TPA: hypothetical protein VIR57_14985 [Chloroflexota bacterium]|jgi:hypothetical protein
MKLALFEAAGEARPGVITERGVVDFDIHGIGRMRLHVTDPLKRSWDKGIYMGADSTNPEAVQRNRPQS